MATVLFTVGKKVLEANVFFVNWTVFIDLTVVTTVWEGGKMADNPVQHNKATESTLSEAAEARSPLSNKEVASKEFKEFGGVKLQIVSGDILQEPVEAIVNETRSFDQTPGGATAEDQLFQIKKRLGKVIPSGATYITSAGDLPSPIQYIIHTKTLKWEPDDTFELNRRTISVAVETVLASATEQKIKSLSLPAIGYAPPLHSPVNSFK